MKNRIVILIASIFLGATFYSCQEEQVGQQPTDSTPPGKITNPQVEPLPGGARISYTLPDDSDLLYVKAVYYVNGEELTDAASIYAKSVEVKGFGSTDEQSVWLYCVDRSGNLSEAEEVKIKPDTPPVTLIFESMTMNAGFGGVQLLWKNKYKTPVVIYVLAADSIGDIQVAGVVYTQSIDGKFNLRGFNDSERIFGVYVRDRWNNYSDTFTGTFTPFLEVEMDKKLFKRQTLYGDNTTFHSSNYVFEKMWDGKWGDYDVYIQRSHVAGTPNYFTIDLGVVAKLGRYTLWQRVLGFEYIHTNLKKWKIYGTDVLNPSTDSEYWMEGWKDDWFLLADCEIIKPSGNGPVTQEDIDAANAGHEFEIPLNAPPVRFIRFHVEKTWDGAPDTEVGEVSFWGIIVSDK